MHSSEHNLTAAVKLHLLWLVHCRLTGVTLPVQHLLDGLKASHKELAGPQEAPVEKRAMLGVQLDKVCRWYC